MFKNNKTAVVLLNLGGPDSQQSVQTFLFNLFNDKAIINIPQPMRFFLAKFISSKRAQTAREIYQYMGGGSPLLKNTKKQAEELEKALRKKHNVKCFVSMRYWHPYAKETAEDVKQFGPEEIILVPLYPQFSTTTTASSLKDWNKAALKVGLKAKTSSVCCFPREKNFIKSHVSLIKPVLQKLVQKNKVRILFTAHSLPEKIVAGGDPYAWQVEKTVREITRELKSEKGDWDSLICYQSRVGPLKWLEPSTKCEIIRAGKEERSLIMVPVAFVSEHSETLVELDIEYAKLAKENRVTHYKRIPALGINKHFIKSLENVVLGALGTGALIAEEGKKICPSRFKNCPCWGK